MKLQFIKLHSAAKPELEIFINTAMIREFYTQTNSAANITGTLIANGEDPWLVKETPYEILSLIKETPLTANK